MIARANTGPEVADSGLEVVDLYTEPSFTKRPLRDRDRVPHIEGMRRLAHAFVESPDTLLQQLVECAIELCDADSAGISIQQISDTRRDAFDRSDAQTMKLLADFAAMAIRQRSQGKLTLDQAGATAASAMANDLAHQINNPLQSLTNLVFLAAEGELTTDIRTLAREMSDDLRRLSVLVSRLLALPNTRS